MRLTTSFYGIILVSLPFHPHNLVPRPIPSFFCVCNIKKLGWAWGQGYYSYPSRYIMGTCKHYCKSRLLIIYDITIQMPGYTLVSLPIPLLRVRDQLKSVWPLMRLLVSLLMLLFQVMMILQRVRATLLVGDWAAHKMYNYRRRFIASEIFVHKFSALIYVIIIYIVGNFQGIQLTARFKLLK